MKFFKGLLVFILILIIVGGIGYVGYSFLFMNHSGMNMTASQTQQTQQPADANKNSSQNQQNSQTNMQHGTTSDQSQQNMQMNNQPQQNNNQVALDVSNNVLQNKDNLNKSLTILNEALRLMSVDPYAPASNSMGNMGGMQSNTQTGNQPASANQGNSTINIYPQNNNTVNVVPPANSNANPQSGNMPQSGVMQNMGTTYDANKMEQLHAGLYKIAVGMSLLNQLNNDPVYQAEYATTNIQNPVQYYSNQYNLTVQNKNKLNQALNYVNEAANLININPYVSSNGLVYDKDRMNQIHQSVFKLAEGVAALNLINDDFTRQTIYLSNMVQNYINNANNSNMAQMNQMAMPSGLFGGLFANISLSSVVNIILIIFVIGLILGIFGFVFSLLKPPVQKAVNKNETV